MVTVSQAQFGSPDKQGLHRFLSFCQERAVAQGHAILASISLPSEYLDPLAVLQSVNDASVEHCYLERHSRQEGVACAEPVLSLSISGQDRFQRAKEFVRQWTDRCVFVGDPNLPWSGPHFFVSAAFEAEQPEGTAFLEESLHLFLPRWQVGWKGARFSATANLRVDANTPLEALIEPIWRAHQRFTSFEFAPEELQATVASPASCCRLLDQEQSESLFRQSVLTALEQIDAGHVEKIVLSRRLHITTEHAFVPLDILNKLRQKFPDCTAFSYQNTHGESFIGATPERLVAVRDGQFMTEALAGSIARGDNARQDAHLSKSLLGSDKDRREHGLVLKFIQETLQSLGLNAEASEIPEILQLSNIQHLRVPLKGSMPAELHLFDLVEALHPTPALGGYPQYAALQQLARIENQPRERYAGLTGWIDTRGEGEFLVNIRCARVGHNRAELFAGAGIVVDSQPENELRETELKFISMLPNFMNLD